VCRTEIVVQINLLQRRRRRRRRKIYEVNSIFYSLIPHEEPVGVLKSNREERYTVKKDAFDQWSLTDGFTFVL
jgi:hypothetical protein